MKKIFCCLSLTFMASMAFGWGQKGHDIVAFIAQKHLTPTTAAVMDSLLDNKSIVYWANWLDNASHTAEYAYTKTWHYKNIDADRDFENAPNIPEGNIVDALYSQIAILQDSSATKDEKALALKMTVHFLGDIHQPLHMGHASDKGGNRWNVKFFKNGKNLHSVWDSNLLNSAHSWSHTEWQEEIDCLSPQDQLIIIQGGTPTSWGKETYEICKTIYETTPESTNIEYDYIADWTPTIESQLLKGGLRLADVLNSIFDNDYQPQNAVVKR